MAKISKGEFVSLFFRYELCSELPGGGSMHIKEYGFLSLALVMVGSKGEN